MNIRNIRVKIRRTAFISMLAVLFIGGAAGTLTSCSEEMDIQQSYPFTVETMPVPSKITRGQTVEIRCEMKKNGEYTNTLYTIRYFQTDGNGSLRMDNGTLFLPNDRYLLENRKFRLYYTSASVEAQSFIVVVEDNFGNSYKMEFGFNNDTKENEKQ